MRDQFIRCAGGGVLPAATGGAANHVHAATTSRHYHYLHSGTDIAAGIDLDEEVGYREETLTTDNGSAMPPFFALLYLMYPL